MHEIFQRLLKQNTLCTIATATKNGMTEAATIEYSEDEAGNLYFETFNTYRKYQNLRENPHASIVITQLPYTIQMDGTVTELVESEMRQAKSLLAAKGHYHKFYENSSTRFFRFTPTWIRIGTMESWPPTFTVIKEHA